MHYNKIQCFHGWQRRKFRHRGPLELIWGLYPDAAFCGVREPGKTLSLPGQSILASVYDQYPKYFQQGWWGRIWLGLTWIHTLSYSRSQRFKCLQTAGAAHTSLKQLAMGHHRGRAFHASREQSFECFQPCFCSPLQLSIGGLVLN